jgi:hypothetical protein
MRALCLCWCSSCSARVARPARRPSTSAQRLRPAVPRIRSRPRPLARAAELALAEVEVPTRDPRRAIIARYATMKPELDRVPGAAPQDFDTASGGSGPPADGVLGYRGAIDIGEVRRHLASSQSLCR